MGCCGRKDGSVKCGINMECSLPLNLSPSEPDLCPGDGSDGELFWVVCPSARPYLGKPTASAGEAPQKSRVLEGSVQPVFTCFPSERTVAKPKQNTLRGRNEQQKLLARCGALDCGRGMLPRWPQSSYCSCYRHHSPRQRRLSLKTVCVSYFTVSRQKT